MSASVRVARARAIFGLPEPETPAGHPAPGEHPLDHLLRLRSGQVAYITGPSGSGKSTLLGALREALDRLGAPRVWVEEPARDAHAVIDTLPGPVGKAVRTLALAGLGEAAIAIRPVRLLSEGERARLGLARAMHIARRGGWVLCDEFARGLDAWTGAGIARALAPWARRARVRLVLAGAREEYAGSIAPTLLIGAGPRARWTWLEGTP